MPATPFTSSTTVESTVAVPNNNKLVVRIEKLDNVQVNLKVNGPCSAADSDYFLQGGEALEIRNNDSFLVNFLAITGTPKVYWRIEPLTKLN